ncbi:MAG: FAD/NAD(P)-binding protein [Planctomycetota bacterium]
MGGSGRIRDALGIIIPFRRANALETTGIDTTAGQLEWLIIGGGIHGVHIAARLLGDAKVSRDRLRIVDPEPRLLGRWRACTSTIGMTFLRSPSVHHLDLDAWSLRDFAGKGKNRRPGSFTLPYDRPSLELFDAHCDKVIDTFGLAELHVRDRAAACSVDCDRVGVELASGNSVAAVNIVLALGSSEQPKWPGWAPRSDPRVQHIFDPAFDGWPTSPETVVVVGGGISAGHTALRLIAEGHQVHVVSRHALREHQFDTDPGWLGPKYVESFRREQDVDRRRAVITKARYVGSVPPDVSRAIRRARGRGLLTWHEADVTSLGVYDDSIDVSLSTSDTVSADRVLLATGFAGRRPGGSLVDNLVESASLPCARCGYPIVDADLRWHPRVYVSGALAELELGPSARNIAGARRAADRLVDSVRSVVT